VLTLRLAPLLPIPLGAYNYVYGITTLSVTDFAAGTFLGSIKPYLLDSYLGVFGKSVIDDSADGSSDAVLLATFAIVVLIGTLASQIAGRTWDEINSEMKGSDYAAAIAAGESPDAALAAAEQQELGWLDMLGVGMLYALVQSLYSNQQSYKRMPMVNMMSHVSVHKLRVLKQ
jgi:hypothetical protein